MDTYEGKCKYCGAEKPIMAESQAAADEEISNTCDYGAASIEQRKAKLMECINFIARGNKEKAMKSLSEEVTKMLRRAGVDVIEGNCDKSLFLCRSQKSKSGTRGTNSKSDVQCQEKRRPKHDRG